MNWSPEQKNAIEAPVSDMIVSAAAGSGKTAVMTERILRRLTGENAVPIDKILVVTYTKAAASEIRERILLKIMDSLNEKEDSVLRSQLLKMGNSHFSTIHSFCLDLIRKYFYKLDIDPNFRIADTTEIKLLKQKAVDEIIGEYYENEDEDFLSLASKYTTKSDEALAESIVSLYNFSLTMPQSEQWLQSLKNAYDGSDNQVISFLLQCLRDRVQYIADCVYEEGIIRCGDDPNCQSYRNLILAERKAAVAAAKKHTYEDVYAAFENMTFARWKTDKAVDSVVTDAIKEIRDKAKKLLKEISDSLIPLSPAKMKTVNQAVLPCVEKLAEAACLLAQRCTAYKKEKNIIDFSDFEHLALQLLLLPNGKPSDIALEISESFDEIYIDEYQDCNNIQEAIFSCISGAQRSKPNLYCVGDMKQSIYRFRDANPILIRNKCEKYDLYKENSGQLYNKILLNSNFRSRDSVLNFVNSVFRQLMSYSCGELEYGDDEQLHYGGGYEDCNADMEWIDIDILDISNSFGDESTEYEDNFTSKLEVEARHVAQRIREIIESNYILYDKKSGTQHPAQYRDIVVLMRGIKESATVFERALSESGIPTFNDSGDGYFDSEEIVFLLNLLKIIDNPIDDIALVSVMRSDIFGFDDNDLLRVRLSLKSSAFYDSILQYINQTEEADTLHIRLKNFTTRLAQYFEKSKYMGTDDFISYVIHDIDYYTYLSFDEDGERKQTNVRYLIHKAKEFEKTNFKGIFSFIRYAENIHSVGNEDSAKVLSENDNVVRIMSIHKSKGLEFPIVFLTCTAKGFNKMDLRGHLILHKDFGIGADAIFREKGLCVPTANKVAIKQKLASETMSEELRVLYVALTRAKEKLIITGSVKNGAKWLNGIDKSIQNCDYKIASYLVSNAKCFLEWILMAVIRSSGCDLSSRVKFKVGVQDSCKYNVNLINTTDIKMEQTNSNRFELESHFTGATEDYPKLCNRISYQYPNSSLADIPGNITVTELKRMTMDAEEGHRLFDDTSLAVPSFFGEKKELTGARYGTLMHLVMEKLDFTKLENTQAICKQLADLQENGVISKEEASSINPEKIMNFISSSIGQRMIANAEHLQREYPFKYQIDAKEAFEAAGEERLILQGTVDAFFVDRDDYIVLVDYKTDKVVDGNTDVLKERYRIQLDYYAKAVEKITGKSVKDKILYLFDADMEVAVTEER